jgi:hypothetical protein
MRCVVECFEPQGKLCGKPTDPYQARLVPEHQSDAVTQIADGEHSSRCAQHCGGVSTELIVWALGVAASDTENVADAVSGMLDAWHNASFRCLAGV